MPHSSKDRLFLIQQNFGIVFSQKLWMNVWLNLGLWVELPWGLCCGILSPWPLVAPYLSVVSRLGFFLWHLFRLGFEGCGPGFGSSLLFFFFGGGGSLSLVLVVLAWLLPLFCVPGSLVFLDFLLGFLSSRLPVFAGSSGWLPYSPWLYALRCLATGIVTLFSVRGLSACPSRTAVPRGSLVLRPSGSLRWGHLSQVGAVFSLSPRS